MPMAVATVMHQPIILGFKAHSRFVTFRLNLAHVLEFITTIKLQTGYLACAYCISCLSVRLLFTVLLLNPVVVVLI